MKRQNEAFSLNLGNQEPVRTKNYGEQLTDNEIKTTTNQLARNQKNFIEKKIEEAETSK